MIIQATGTTIISDIFGVTRVFTNLQAIEELKEISRKGMDVELVRAFKKKWMLKADEISYDPLVSTRPTKSTAKSKVTKEQYKKAVEEFNKMFLTYIEGESVRLYNTAKMVALKKERLIDQIEEAKTFLRNYFRIQNHQEYEKIKGDIASEEFEELFTTCLEVKPDHAVNKRFEILFGGVGAGKTSYATSLYPTADVINGDRDVRPEDLKHTFTFMKDGKPQYKDSSLVKAMREGKPIILDEINKFNEDCYSFIQAITDNKKTIKIDCLEDPVVTIGDGFKIIGTMNLIDTETGGAMPLNMAMTDRACAITEYKMTLEDFIKYADGDGYNDLAD